MTIHFHQVPCASLLLATISPLCAASVAKHQLDIANEVPKFEKFYAGATKRPLSEAARLALWKKEYGIAAVPPGPKHDQDANFTASCTRTAR